MSRLQTQPAFSSGTRSEARCRQVVGIVGSALLIAAAFWFDAAALDFVTQHRSPGSLAFMRTVSRWGDWYSHVLAGVLLAAIAYARGNRKWFRVFVAMLIACAIAGAVTRVVKVTTGRARPAIRTEAGWNGPRFDSKYNAFPSGHTASSTAFFATLAFASPRIGLALLPIPLLIAFSRIYVGAHHLSDVVCAALLGILTAWLVFRSKRLSMQDAQADANA